MLHVSPRSGQARCTQPLGRLDRVGDAACAACTAPASSHRASDRADAGAGGALAREGEHLAAAARYEQLARRGFMNWDATTALLAAREYVMGGALDDAQRLPAKCATASGPTTSAHCALEVDARLALARSDAARALVALRALPQRLADRSRRRTCSRCAGSAEIASGDALSGVRTFEERGRAARLRRLSAPRTIACCSTNCCCTRRAR